MLTRFRNSSKTLFRLLVKKSTLKRYDSDCTCGTPKWTGTYNDLPQPECDWNRKNAENQKRHNKNFILGVGFLLATIAFGFPTGLFASYHSFPDRPAESNDYCGTK